MEFFDTIVAISTPLGSGGISVIRLSGKQALDIVLKIVNKPKQKFENRKMVLCKVTTQNFCDNALVVYFNAPYTYTGEDVVEIQCHGGLELSKGILNECVLNGARLAQNGEFTKRAFLNGKMSLEEAEGVIDMINAETEGAIRAGYDLLNGELKKRVKNLQQNLSNIFAEIEVSLDYPEETIEFSTREQIAIWLKQSINEIDNLLKTYVTGNFVKNGVRCAIVGKPNVGKSSTMNSLLGYDRAIVTNIAGTTRDTLEESYVFKSVKFSLVDTAGLRESDDIIEKIGIERAYTNLKSADIVLFMVDAQSGVDDDYKKLLENVDKKRVLIVINKTDLVNDVTSIKNQFKNDYSVLTISALNNSGIDDLKEKLYSMVINENITNSFMITSSRHKDVLDKTKNSLTNALNSLSNGVDIDLVNIDIVEAWNTLGDITGETSSEERINTIFARFCLGK